MNELDKNPALKAMVVFRKAQRTLDAQSSAFFQKANLTPTQFSVLEVLYSKGSMRINKLIGSLLATSGNMTVVLKNMERNGWISRCQDAKDKRACLVQLTPEGKALIETILPEHIKRVEALFSVLTEIEQKQLITLLKKFKEL
ncbi:TPA: MarR family transcriptional regulator [Streptococcus equi subsp. zooepidemicus]|uniref:MarR family winged helix-turn-helix transcriptional regulator n=1 Tax=Streptococcus equi TaxID=1336 RepID=UPI001E63D97D|nr:MarR family transcriptional regulator [Streptococcus equi]MCD3415422.1 MarR family transcriptional regulator [Streptococcus equi subsp. zooepidemicus]HEL0588407.1 MarR family transcriptional regulator [Streptococcus equi subsp. zooepidemicus]HEL1146051.1 MarR family transcriptional regulator [Streptococcus equi subsp. zooepidemicus]HEL1536375.1 MarR family transcriptional regulator [Streptococcus equi subsp. zooepidemicus]